MNGRAAVLSALPGTCPQIAAATGFSLPTVQRFMNEMMQQRQAHIGSRILAAAQGRSIRCYALGPGVDAPPLFKDPTRARPAPQAKRQPLQAFNLAPMPAPPCMASAVMAQNRAFALAGVWA